MIDPTTLPQTQSGVEIEAGTRFEIKGLNFDVWPSELVLSFDRNHALTDSIPSSNLMKVVEKEHSKLIVETTETHTFFNGLTWTLFATPFDGQRTIVDYYTE